MADPSPASDLAAMPLADWFGLRFDPPAPDGARVRLPMRPELLQTDGIVHGGVLATLADTAAVGALLPELARGERMTSIEFKVDFLAAARPAGGELVATARCLRAGRSILRAEADVEQGPTRIARATLTYLRLSPAAPASAGSAGTSASSEPGSLRGGTPGS